MGYRAFALNTDSRMPNRSGAPVAACISPAGIYDLTGQRGELFPAEQERIVRLPVERVVVGEAGAEITLKLGGIAGLARDLMSRPPEMRRAA